LFWRKLLPERLLESLMIEFKSVREATSAGISPKMTPVTMDSTSVNSTTRQSMPSSAPSCPSRGNPAVLTVKRKRMPI
jgi:hypothetical protein